MITILGKLADTKHWIGRNGFNAQCATDAWTPEIGRSWLDEAIARGDEFALVSDELTGVYRMEVEYLLSKLSGHSRVKVTP